MPAMGTVHAKVRPMSQPRKQASVTAEMNRMFSKTGAAAAATKRPVAFKTPESSAASEMNKM